MSTLKASYSTNNTSQVIQVPLDASKPLTDSIIHLQEKVNTFLTNILEEEKKTKKAAEVIKTVQQDEAEQELKEIAEAEQDEDVSSPMVVDQPEEKEETQSAKKQKIDL